MNRMGKRSGWEWEYYNIERGKGDQNTITGVLTFPRPIEKAMHERMNSNLLDHCSRSR